MKTSGILLLIVTHRILHTNKRVFEDFLFYGNLYTIFYDEFSIRAIKESNEVER